MGWTLMTRKQISSMMRLFLALTVLALASTNSQAAYVPPPGFPGYNNVNTDGSFTPDTFLTMANSYLQLSIGIGNNQGGAIGIFTADANPTDPTDTLLYYEPLIPKDTPAYVASRVFVRVDGGINGGHRGMDYEWGQPDTTKAGQWLQYPTVVGGHMIARWETFSIAPLAGTNNGTGAGTGTGTGTTNTTPINPQIEIDMLASFIHNQVRFQFNIINNDAGHSHTVGMVFEQAHALTSSVPPDVLFPNHVLSQESAPLRIPNQPYLRTETLLTGTNIPAYWEIQQPYTTTRQGANGTAHTVRGTMRPTATSGTEPTIPSAFALGQSVKLDGLVAPPLQNNTPGGTGVASVPGPSGRYFDTIWNFTPNPNVRFDNVGSPYGSIALYYDEQPVSPGQSLPIVAYVGQSDSDIDVGTPIGLVVTAPSALSYSSSTGNVPFTVSAYVTNLLDLQPGGGIAISPVGVSLDLPAGLVFKNDTSSKSISTIAAGAEGSVSWNVVADGTKTGLLTFTVTAAAGIGPGKSVQRTVYVPNVPAIDLVGNQGGKGLYQMISVPLDTRGDLITTVLYPGQDPNLVTPDVVTFNPATGKYQTATTFSLGQAYWIRTRSANAQHITFNVGTGGYQPVANQVQPTASAYTVNYNEGWNQMGNPYLYPINFSEIEIFDPSTMAISTVADASSPTNQLVLPAVYAYDTTDPLPANWHYVLQPSIGFQMQPYTGYWVYLRRANLQFLYPGVDVPGVTVSRAAKLGVGFTRKLSNAAPEVLGRGTSSNWRLQVSAKSDNGYDPDNYIGVAPNATDSLDNYKYSKPPVMNRTVSLDIAHPEWTGSGRYAQDLRSPALGTKTWSLKVTSVKPNDSVTLTWPSIASSVPRGWSLSLIDPTTNQHILMRNTLSHTVATGNDGTGTVQIVAEPSSAQQNLAINTFEIVNNTLPTRGTVSANINFTLNGAGDAQVLIHNSRGQVIRTLTPTTKAAGAGISTGSTFWDLKTQQGSAVATGAYSVELRVTASSGRSARRTASFLVTR